MLMEMSPLLYDFAVDVSKEVLIIIDRSALKVHFIDDQL